MQLTTINKSSTSLGGVNIVGQIIMDDGKPAVAASPYLETNYLDATINNETGHIFESGNKNDYANISTLLKRIGNNTKHGKLLNASGLFGRTATNPIPAHTIFEELEYLKSLCFLDGRSGTACRLGSVVSPVSKYVVDCYLIISDDTKSQEYIFIDPHCKETCTSAPDGYKLLLNPALHNSSSSAGWFRRIFRNLSSSKL